jgi:hypothetical protein
VWLSRVLGSVVEEELEGMDGCGGELREIPAPENVFNKKGSFSPGFGERPLDSKTAAEFRLACSRVGRGMVRVLTFGMVQG